VNRIAKDAMLFGVHTHTNSFRYRSTAWVLAKILEQLNAQLAQIDFPCHKLHTVPIGWQKKTDRFFSPLKLPLPMGDLRCISYTVFHKKRGSTFVVITLDDLDGF